MAEVQQQQQQQQSSVQQSANGASWADSFDADTKGWVSGMGLDKLEPAAALAKVLPMYRGAEQKLGVPADQLLRLPGKDAKPEDIRAMWSKLGAPEKPEGYELKDGDPEFMKSVSTWFHEIGVPKPMAHSLAGKWNEYVKSRTEAAGAEWDKRFDTEMGELKTEWGQDFDKNRDLARRVERVFGLPPEKLQGIERALGPRDYQKLLARFGSTIGEHRFQGDAGNTAFAMSQQQAAARIEELKKDQEWQKAYLAGDAEKKSEWTKLHQIAHPEPIAA